MYKNRSTRFNDITVTALILRCIPYTRMDGTQYIQQRAPPSKQTPLLLHCRPADIQFPSNLFLPSCSVGVVCPCAKRGNVINMTVIPYQLAQSFLKKCQHFSKILLFSVFQWSFLKWRLHHSTSHDFRWTK